jgi:hypothetical protein
MQSISKKLVLAIIVITIALAVGGLFWYVKNNSLVIHSFGSLLSGSKEYAQSLPSDEIEQKYVDVASLKLDNVFVLFDGTGYSFDFANTQEAVINTISNKDSISVGFRLSSTILPLNTELIEISIDGANAQTFPSESISIKDNTEYIVTYAPKNIGEDTINISLKGSQFQTKIRTRVFDSSIITENKLWYGNVLYNEPTKSIMFSDYSSEPPIFRGESFPWGFYTPGFLSVQFSSERIRGKGTLDIYTLPENVSQLNNENSVSFYGHIRTLSGILQNKENNDYEFLRGTTDFPPVNAAIVGVNHLQRISGNYVEGVRYIHAGYAQGVDIPEQPTYVFQGISKDGRFFFHFSFEMMSDSLRVFLQKNNNCYVGEFKEQERCMDKAFEVLAAEKSFDPGIAELDHFIQSLGIK